MAAWKTDSLLRLVFAEIGALWEEMPAPDQPLLFRVEERKSVGSAATPSTSRLVNVWLFDDYGIRLAPILRREVHEFGELRGGYNRYGLVTFEVSADRSHLVLAYRVGPAICGEITYEVRGEANAMELHALSDSLAI